jgi:hypothetical protein
MRYHCLAQFYEPIERVVFLHDVDILVHPLNVTGNIPEGVVNPVK